MLYFQDYQQMYNNSRVAIATQFKNIFIPNYFLRRRSPKGSTETAIYPKYNKVHKITTLKIIFMV